MDKSFEEVFSAVDIDNDLKGCFADSIVERLILNEKENIFRLYISDKKIIPKNFIMKLEKELARKLLKGRNLTVYIHEKYQLSEVYTLKSWFEAYKDSIVLELEAKDIILCTLFKKSDFVVSENVLNISLPDSMIARNKEHDLIEIIHRIGNERFGLEFSIEVDYKEPEASKFRIENEKRAERRLAEIAKTNGYSGENDPDAISIKDLINQDGLTIDPETGEILNPESATISEDISSTVAQTTSNDISESEKPKTISKPKEEASATKEYGAKTLKSGSDKTGAGKWKKAGSRDGKEFTNSLVRSDNPNVIFRRDFEGDAVSLEDVQDDIGEVVVKGQVIGIDERFLNKSGKYVFKIEISDFTDSLKIKLFLTEELANEFRPKVKNGDFITAKGIVQFDNFDRELEMSNIVGIMKTSDWRVKREDHATVKRVELHLHTKMSDSDGVSDVGSLIKAAAKYGHTAMAVTDHGNVQSFPIANHAIDKLPDFKVIYGVEGYLVDDEQKCIYNSKGQRLDGSFVVFDIETTGFSPVSDMIIEIGAVKVVNGKVTDRFSEFVNPQRPIPFEIEQLTSINDSMVADAQTIEEVLPRFMEFVEGSVLVAHNANFDVSFISAKCDNLGISHDFTYVDTMGLSRIFHPSEAKHNLDAVCKAFKLVNNHHHRAVDDAEVTSKIFEKFVELLYEAGVHDMDELDKFGKLPDEAIARLKSFHIIILAKNEVGRRNLYTLVSQSNLRFFNRRPKIPRSLIKQYREGLIIGSACEAGELYQAIVRGEGDDRVADIVDFYDYLEIQPIGNNMYQVESPKYPNIHSPEDIKDINRKIVKLGEIYNKPVCATCDVHFLNPEDGIYREIIITAKGMGDEEQAPLYLHTTDEMIEEFAYLGTDKCYEVVVTNTNLIADMCDKITPVRPDKCPPVIEDSDKTLRTICYTKAHEMYGAPLPKIVEDRLERELTSIIGNGFAVMYIIAQKLVWKSVEDGYLVGSRGSVGSSFVATMAGITEVNPLPPHYYCTECFYNDFDSEDVKKWIGFAGCDMPDKVCPKCGKKMHKDGFDIPFETFLGFKGDKEPDIDLNFSGEYQSKAHKYTEVIFGYGQTFRAGTIGALAENTAYGLIKKYYEGKGTPKREGEINRLIQGCIGVKRSTGQHPGGIVVLPVGEDINSFTPIQHPADDVTTDIITTHYDYHSIDHNLLKLDILGHDDPTMIRMLQDLTGIDPVKIPLDDPEVMSLFQDTHALGVTPDQIRGCKLGSLGIPEFGTDFAMQMLIDTNPQYFSDLVRIAGLSHGTDVWLNNAQTLLQEGKATISTCISTRDDIMTYLINMGVESGTAFSIMENVRKGKVAKGACDKWEGWKEIMKENNVPDWYIWSCEQIKYMFPKAHAAAYVMMAWRIAYCKINYPLAYYAAFFSIRAKQFDYESMCMGQAKLEANLDELEAKSKREKLSATEDNKIRDMRIVQEMYARGFEFMPIDLYKAKAKNFQIIDGKIMPAFTSIGGLGDQVAINIEDEARKGQFMSKDDLSQRAKVSGTIIQNMSDLGILDGMSQSNQLSLFDFMD